MSDTAPGTELAEIERAVGTPEYWRDEGMQARYRELVTARDAGTAAPARQNITTTTPSRDGSALVKTLNHRDLIAEHDRQNAASADSWRATPAQARERLPAQLVAEWDSEPQGFDAMLARMQNATRDIAASIGDEAAINAFVAGIDRLPTGAQIAVKREIAAPTPAYVRPLDAGAMADVTRLPNGAAMLDAWGRRGRHNASLAVERINRAHAAAAEQDRPAVRAWWANLPPVTKAAALWVLGSQE